MLTSALASLQWKNWRASSVRIDLLVRAFEPHIPKQARVLDLGCGNGEISKVVERHFDATMMCADVENFLEYDLPFHRVNGKLDFEDDEFDIVMLNDVLHHIPREGQLDMLREGARVGRTVLVFETAPTITAKAFDVLMNYVVYGGREAVPLAHRSPPAWTALMANAGMAAEAIELKVPLYYPLRHFVLLASTEKGERRSVSSESKTIAANGAVVQS